MGIKEDYQQAQQLVRDGKLLDARALLLNYDHPKTNALRKKIERVMVKNRATTTNQTSPTASNSQYNWDKLDRNMTGEDVKRGCWLTGFLVVLALSFVLLTAHNIIYASSPRLQANAVPLLIFIIVVDVVMLISLVGVWRWKFWGIVGVYAVLAIHILINLLSLPASPFLFLSISFQGVIQWGIILAIFSALTVPRMAKFR
ncbi:MAG: hypothetical protein AAFV98_21035 [Chloroflexota bacterium]